MSRVSIVALLGSLFAVPAVSVSADLDTDGDSLAFLAKLPALYPELSDHVLAGVDSVADCFLDDEHIGTIYAELLPGPQGGQ